MKIIRLVIIILLIAIIGIVGLIFTLNLRGRGLKNNTNILPPNNYIKDEQININEEVDNLKNITDEYGPKLTFNTDIQEIISNSEMYSISQNIGKYYNYIKDNNIDAVNELGGAIEYNINNNIKFTAKKVFVTSNEYQSKYYIKGNLLEFTEDFIVSEQEKYIIMYLDLNNNSYKVEESTIEQFQNMDKLSDNQKIDIINGNYNKYEYIYIDGTRQLELYLEDYAFYLVKNIDRSYNLLEEEYRAKRFIDISEFNEYALNNQSRFQNIEIKQYNIIKEDENTSYIGIDENGNYYKIIL